MKKALLFCIVGLLCIGGGYANASDETINGNLTVTGNTGVDGNLTAPGIGVGTAVFDDNANDPRGLLRIKSYPLSGKLSGTVQVSHGGYLVLGTGTKFTTELAVGDLITVDSVVLTVSSILSDLALNLTSDYQGVGGTGITAYRGIVAAVPLFTIDTDLDGVAIRNFTISDSGKVGIGTRYPNANLQVKGSIGLGSGSPLQGKLLCWTSSNKIGYCSAPPASGSTTCTCTSIE